MLRFALRRAVSSPAIGCRARTRGLAGSSQLASTDLINSWFDDDRQLVADLNFYRRGELWTMLRLLPGFDLPDFLEGCKVAYPAVTTLMYTRQFDELATLTSPACCEAMRATIEGMADDGHRTQLPSDGVLAEVLSARLRSVQLLQSDDGDTPPGACHVWVDFEAEERLTIYDYHTHEPIPPFDGSVRVQTSTWVFSGVVNPGDEEGAAGASDHRSAGEGWRVHTIA